MSATTPTGYHTAHFGPDTVFVQMDDHSGIFAAIDMGKPCEEVKTNTRLQAFNAAWIPRGEPFWNDKNQPLTQVTTPEHWIVGDHEGTEFFHHQPDHNLPNNVLIVAAQQEDYGPIKYWTRVYRNYKREYGQPPLMIYQGVAVDGNATDQFWHCNTDLETTGNITLWSQHL